MRFLLLLLLCGSAQAFDCAPSPLGPGTKPVYRVNLSGAVVWWYCKRPDGTWTPQYAAATHAWMASNPAIDVKALYAATNKRTAVNALLTPTVPFVALEPVWAQYTTEILAGPQ